MKLLRLHHDKAIKERHNLSLKKTNNLLCVTNIKVTIKNSYSNGILSILKINRGKNGSII